MLVESYITNGCDISHYNQSCNLIKNNRSSNDQQYMESSFLHCEEPYDFDALDLSESFDSLLHHT